MASDTRYYGTGRRKTSVARVWLKAGGGNILVNRRAFEEYFPRETLRMVICQPLQLTSTLGQFDAIINVGGGGPSGPGGRGAARHRPRAPAVRRQAAADAQAGGAADARSPHAGAQEVRAAGRPVEVPVLEAVGDGHGRSCRQVAVAGASGYMGAELLRLLTVHPKVESTAVTSERLSGERLDHVFPHLRGLSDLTFQELDAARLAEQADVVFLALPHMESQRAVPVLREPRPEGDRPLRRLPPARRLALHHLVQGRARRRRWAQGGGVRDAGAASKGDRGLPRWSPRRGVTPWEPCSPWLHSWRGAGADRTAS